MKSSRGDGRAVQSPRYLRMDLCLRGAARGGGFPFFWGYHGEFFHRKMVIMVIQPKQNE